MGQNTVEILQQLITIPSYVDKNNNEDKLCLYIKDFFTQNSKYPLFREQIVEGTRTNLVYASKTDPKIVLFGHMDTVLPKQNMFEPFNPRIIEDRLYGLGAVDMKAGLAIMLSIASTYFHDEIGFVFSVDEEYEFKGAYRLQEIADFKPLFIINIEPTDNKIINGCRGVTEFRFVVHGQSSHAGRKKDGINAIEKAVALTERLQEHLTITNNIGVEMGQTTLNLAYLHGGILNTSPQGNNIQGYGNVVPDFAEVVCEIRIANQDITQKFISETISSLASELSVSVSDLAFKFYLGPMVTPKEELVDFERAITGIGLEPVYGNINEAGYYEVQMLQECWHSNSIVFGPGPSSVSHTKNEYVEISSIQKAELGIRKYLDQELSK